MNNTSLYKLCGSQSLYHGSLGHNQILWFIFSFSLSFSLVFKVSLLFFYLISTCFFYKILDGGWSWVWFQKSDYFFTSIHSSPYHTFCFYCVLCKVWVSYFSIYFRFHMSWNRYFNILFAKRYIFKFLRYVL